ncbi:hypothetical protein JCM33374_g2607 [Metschnikowia sp. JCM 33374]|nr:hypothetical protein JCM33374_g2607 [Metschnikowia sp. JCM 33374]
MWAAPKNPVYSDKIIKKKRSFFGRLITHSSLQNIKALHTKENIRSNHLAQQIPLWPGRRWCEFPGVKTEQKTTQNNSKKVAGRQVSPMNSIYNHGVKQTQVLTRDLATFEKNLSTSPMSLQGTIITSLTAFKKTVKEYGDVVGQNNFVEEKHKARLAKFRTDLAQFQAKFDSLRQQREISLQAETRQELMGRRNVHGDNPYGQASSDENNPAQNSHMSYSEGLYKEKQTLGRSTQQLDMILEMGQNALGDLVEQNETLKRFGAKFEQSLMTLGVSQGTIRRVERRARQDKWIFWALVIIFFVLCYFIMKWFH